MVAQVISFFQRQQRPSAFYADWTQQELAEFYRVESALIRAGIRVGTDRGLSDENEPWFIFYRSDDGEVVIHFARIDGEYIIAGPAYEEIARGLDFSSLVRNMVERHPLIRRQERGNNVSIHPAALLIAVVGTAFFKTGEARAAETGATNGNSAHNRPALLQSSSGPAVLTATGTSLANAAYDTAQLPANQAVLVLAAALLASDYRSAPIAHDATASIAAAAASLDFTGAAAVVGSSETTFAATPSRAQAVDNAPASTVSSVLSLMALLSTMPAAHETLATGGGGGSGGSGGNGGGNSSGGGFEILTPRAPDPTAGQWSIEVRMDWTHALNIEAVQLVRAAVGDGPPQQIAVIEVEKLPVALADIIARGTHYDVAPPVTETPEAPAVVTPPPPATGGGATDPGGHDTDTGSTGGGATDGGLAGGGSSGGSTGGITDGAPTGGSGGSPAIPDPTPTQPTIPTPTPPKFATQDLVKQFVEYFIAHTHDVEIMSSGQQVVIYDARVLNDPGAIDHLTSITFTFFDGSSVNLVGDHSSFLHGGILV